MLTPFSGRKQDYPAFKNRYLTLAQQSSTLCPYNHGLLGFVLSPADYLLLVFPALHIPAPFEPVLPPGDEPALDGDANTLAVSRHNAEWSSWKFNYEKFQTQQKELNSFKMIFLQSLDSTTIKRISDPIHGTRQLTVGAIHNFLGTRFGTMVSVDLISLSASLAIPYQTSIPIEILLQVHRNTHGNAAAQNQPFPEYQMVHLFRVAVFLLGYCFIRQ